MNYLQKDFAKPKEKYTLTHEQYVVLYRQLMKDKKRIDQEIEELWDSVA